MEATDLMKFGLIPEFVGRLPVVVGLLTEPKNSLTDQYKALFKYDSCDLEFDDDAPKAVAKQAQTKGTGARGLRAIVERILLEPMYEVPGSEIKSVTITKDVVVNDTSPIYSNAGGSASGDTTEPIIENEPLEEE